MKFSTLFALLAVTLMTTSTNARIGTRSHSLPQSEEEDLAKASLATAPTASPSPTYSVYFYNFCNSTITINVDSNNTHNIKEIQSGAGIFLGDNYTGAAKYMFKEEDFDDDDEKGQGQGEIGWACTNLGSALPLFDDQDGFQDNACGIPIDVCESGTIYGN